MTEELTDLIGRARDGDREAADRLFTVVYAELRAIAGRQRQGVDAAGMGATSLVHESYMRLIRGMSLRSERRAHFFATAARAMRQIAIDRLRIRAAEKRGGDAEIASLDDGLDQAADGDLGQTDLFALDQCPDPALILRCAPVATGGVARLRRHEPGGSRRRTRHVRAHAQTRLAQGACIPACATGRRRGG